MKRKLLFWILLSGCLIALAGCADNKTSPQQLVMWLVGSESQAKVIQEIGDEFFQGKDIAFTCEALSWSDAHTKYLTSIAAEVVPDIGTMGLTWGTEFGHLGAMVDLAKEFPADTERIRQTTFPGLWEAAEYKGSNYGVPFDLSLQIMFYRSDIISNPPATWQELTETLKNLKAQNRGMIFDWGSMSWIGLAPYLWQAGGDFYNRDGTSSTLDSEEAAAALKFFASFYTQWRVPKTRIPVEQGMRTGDFPLAISGNWTIDGLRTSAPEIDKKWAIALLPVGPTGRRTTFLGGRIAGIFKKSRNKQMAWEFIKFLFQPRTQIKLYTTARAAQDSYLPSNILTWDALPMESEFRRILKEQAKDGKGPPSVLGWDESTRFIERAIQRVVLQEKDIKVELSKAAREMDRYIK